MKIVLTGGGSGGHITPLLAVAHELKSLEPDIELIYVGQRGDKLADIPKEHPDIDQAYTVRAGKFRRYGTGLKQLIDVSTNLKNIRDSGRVVVGLTESYRLLKKLQPDLIFIKGGFVGVPVGLAAARLGIPFVTHDSDAMPGLANRIIAKWAAAHAVALPKEIYPYPPSKTFTVGVPVHSQFEALSASKITQYREALGLQGFDQLVLVTGGGNGARKLNNSVIAIAGQLLAQFPKAAIVHVAGRDHEEAVRETYKKILGEQAARIVVKGFVSNFFEYSGAADLIIARGSATNLAEFAVQKKACIIVPAEQLVWTVKNAQTLKENGAAVVLEEPEIDNQPELLAEACKDMLADSKKRQEIGNRLSQVLAHPQAARELAELLLKVGKNKNV